MTAVSTLIRKVERDPRYPRYVQALLDGGIRLETAIRAAAVRIESEEADERRWAKYDRTVKYSTSGIRVGKVASRNAFSPRSELVGVKSHRSSQLEDAFNDFMEDKAYFRDENSPGWRD